MERRGADAAMRRAVLVDQPAEQVATAEAVEIDHLGDRSLVPRWPLAERGRWNDSLLENSIRRQILGTVSVLARPVGAYE
jgi:hypothetical protein